MLYLRGQYQLSFIFAYLTGIIMRTLLSIIMITFIQITSNGQNFKASSCVDSSKYRLDGKLPYAELEIKINNNWKSFRFIEETLGRFNCTCAQVELNDSGSKELVVKWSNARYGSGGGSTKQGIQIWNLDNGTRFLKEITSCSEENFGRHEAKGYLVVCNKEIELIEKRLRVHEKKCKTKWSEAEDVPDPVSYNSCSLTTLNKGIYLFKNGALKQK